MARYGLSVGEEFGKSPFGVSARTGARRREKNPKPTFAPRHTEHNRRAFELVQTHLARRCMDLGKRPMLNVRAIVPLLAKHPLSEAKCWEWLLGDYEYHHSETLAADDGLRLAFAFARGRVFAMWLEEQDRFGRLQLAKATEERQRLFAQERADNGGEVEFFNTNSWQRLRYEVLAESNGCCCLCGRSHREDGVALEVDHIKPRSRFPSLALDKSNLQVMCFDCNRGKGNRCDTDWRPHAEPEAA